MRTQLNSLILAAFAASTLGGCIVERQVVRDDTQAAALPAPPPPPSDEVDAQPPGPVAAPEPISDQVDEQVFVDRLSPYGHWEYVADYGRVWVPAAAVGWRPYWDGHWVLTEWGWTFVSDDPWGWATYHYGRWGFLAGVGWFWVPGRVWAPAWVSWRYGNGYCAWAPLGPRGYVYGYQSPAWVAVRQEHFTQPIVRYGVADSRQVGPIVQRAQPLPAPRGRPAPGVHFGPPVAQVAAASGQQIRPVRAAAVVPRAAPAAHPTASASGRGGGAFTPARPAPSSEGTSRSRPSAAPSEAPSSGAPARAEPGSSGSSGSSGSRAQPSAPSRGTPRAAPAHGGPSGSNNRSQGSQPVQRSASVAPSATPRYGGGPAPRPSTGHASSARRSNHTR